MKSTNISNTARHWIVSPNADSITCAALAKFQDDSVSSWSRPGLLVQAGSFADYISAELPAKDFVNMCAKYESYIARRHHDHDQNKHKAISEYVRRELGLADEDPYQVLTLQNYDALPYIDRQLLKDGFAQYAKPCVLITTISSELQVQTNIQPSMSRSQVHDYVSSHLLSIGVSEGELDVIPLMPM